MKKFIFAVVLFGLLFAKNLKAEYCWMIGCEGMAGYIFITDAQQWKEKKGTVVINGIEHVISNPDSQFLFKDVMGLPEVGQKVELDLTTPLYLEEEFERRKEVFKKEKSGLWEPYIGINDVWKTGFTYPSTRDGDFPMLDRTIVEVLGYKTFNIDGEDYLFLYASIIKDGMIE